MWGEVAGALTGDTPGGAELQIALLARSLLKVGHEVVILDFTIEEEFTTDEGIRILPIKGWNSGLRFIRFFTHRIPQLYKSLKAQKADIYYCRIADFRHILAYWAARKVHGKFILGLAHDLEAMNHRMRLRNYVLVSIGGLWWFFNSILIELIHPWLLRKADYVFVQHEGQKQILQKKNIKSIIFRNIVDLSQYPNHSNQNNRNFIYVGRLDRNKGFIKFIELIDNAPLQSFYVVGQPQGRMSNLLYEKLKSYKNVKLFGRLSHSETLLQISNAKALISTSQFEGFPNIFLEAWVYGIPVLSLYVDPGDIIKNEKLGKIYNGDFKKLIKDLTSVKAIEDYSTKARTYVELNHALNEERLAEIDKLFSSL